MPRRKRDAVNEAKPKSDADLILSFSVEQTPAQVYDAILREPEWWIGENTGEYDRVGAEFTYAYKEFHRTVQRVKTLVPNKLVEWEVLESSIHFVEDKEEWKGTTIRFEILSGGGSGVEGNGDAAGKTTLRFTHIGLTPKIECYQNCSAGWEFYILESLQSLIKTGRGVTPPF
jgi:hypothetical protein